MTVASCGMSTTSQLLSSKPGCAGGASAGGAGGPGMAALAPPTHASPEGPQLLARPAQQPWLASHCHACMYAAQAAAWHETASVALRLERPMQRWPASEVLYVMVHMDGAPESSAARQPRSSETTVRCAEAHAAASAAVATSL